jgi:sterol desaturase/sphingolipid hydroxylase (fatty acid hydroxylase superfamily)
VSTALLEREQPVEVHDDFVSRQYRRADKFTLWVITIAVLLCFWQLRNPQFIEACTKSIQFAPELIHITCVSELALSYWFYGALAISLIFEKLLPAKARQGTLTFSGAYDAAWVVPKFVFFATAWPIFINLLHAIYSQYFSFLTVTAVSHWHWFGRFLLALLLSDFLHWLMHVARHKLRSLWQFHAVHHSQKNLNFFTEYRSHYLDDLLKYALEAVPLFMFEQAFVQVLLVNRLRYWHTAVYHSNIRSNFGWLRYIFVTPQSHRIHHSSEMQHRDCNYGLTFSIWDHVFGTQYRQYDEYPDTGVDDVMAMEEKELGSGNWKVLLEQMFYPLRLSSLKRQGKQS